MSVRPRLFGIAYRMLGSAAEAEDIVQDVWVRWQTTDRTPGSGRRGIPRDDGDTTGDQRHAVGTLAPGDVRRTLAAGTRRYQHRPRLGAERGQALACGVLLLLEKLTPTERAAYILREAFDYPYRDIANVLRLEEANARQVVTRARQHVANGRRMPRLDRAQTSSSTRSSRQSNTAIAGLKDLASTEVAGRVSQSVRRSVISSTTLGNIESAQHGKDIDHETRHHRRHRAHRIEARDQLRNTAMRPCRHRQTRASTPSPARAWLRPFRARRSSSTSRTLLRSRKRPSWSSSPPPRATFSSTRQQPV